MLNFQYIEYSRVPSSSTYTKLISKVGAFVA